MKKKARLKAKLDRRLPKDESDTLWWEATNRLSELFKQYAPLPKGMRFHTDNKILPAAAIYLTLKERIGQPEAYRIIEGATFETADSIGKKLAALMRNRDDKHLRIHGITLELVRPVGSVALVGVASIDAAG